MGKNVAGGNKQKSKKNHAPRHKSVPINEITPDNRNKYVGKVIKTLGSCRVQVEAFPTSDQYNALIPGSFRNRIWINTDDFVLLEVSNDIGGNNCYIIHKYDDSEIEQLINLGHLTIRARNDDHGDIIFGENDDDEDLAFENI